jgi:hypothetical protein
LAQRLEQPAEIDHIIDHALHPDLVESTEPRVSLTEGGWKALRDACPPDTRSASIDIEVAKRVLGDPAVFNRALSLEPESVAHAGRPASSALH